jgi:hypothetical protein
MSHLLLSTADTGKNHFTISICDYVMNIMGLDLCYQCHVIGVGTTHGMNPVQRVI